MIIVRAAQSPGPINIRLLICNDEVRRMEALLPHETQGSHSMAKGTEFETFPLGIMDPTLTVPGFIQVNRHTEQVKFLLTFRNYKFC